MAEQTKKAWYKKWWVWVIAVLVLAGIGGAMSGGGAAETQGAEQSSQKQEQSSQQTESPTPLISSGILALHLLLHLQNGSYSHVSLRRCFFQFRSKS